MNSLVNLWFYKCLFPLGLLIAALFLGLLQDRSPILIESLESKTEKAGKVFNRIQLNQKNGTDIWLMEQSHYGVHAKKKLWDNIAIKVTNNQAEFIQYQNSEKNISTHLKHSEFKVSCFFCHSNGPRAIRPNYNSKEAPISFWNQARIMIWNLKIKTYGKLIASGGVGARPLRHPHPLANQKLEIKTCNLCHKDSGLFARGDLYKQNTMAIRFMVENGQMPPPGFQLSPLEKEKLNQFLKN